jgi:hypothetical protein
MAEKRFTVIPQDTFEEMQVDAGVILTAFDPAHPAAPDENIVCATTGGIQASCVPSYQDLGEDVDNCPVNTKELKDLTGWECKLAFTSLDTSPESIALSLGAADIETKEEGGQTVTTGKVTPRRDLKNTDFKDEIWWVGDKANGGFLAACLKNVLSTSGLSLQTTKSGKGQTAVELTGHVSINDLSTVPMEFYSIDPA